MPHECRNFRMLKKTFICDHGNIQITFMVVWPAMRWAKDYKALYHNLIVLLDNENKRKEIAQNGYHYIQDFT